MLKFLQQIYVLEVSFPKHASVKDSKAILGQSISIFVRHAEQLICRCNYMGGWGRGARNITCTKNAFNTNQQAMLYKDTILAYLGIIIF